MSELVRYLTPYVAGIVVLVMALVALRWGAVDVPELLIGGGLGLMGGAGIAHATRPPV